MRSQIKRHAYALPARSQRLAIKRIGFFGGRKARILPNRPRPHGIHRGLRAANERLKARQRVGMRQIFHVFRRIQRLDGDAIRRMPIQGIDIAARGGFGRSIIMNSEFSFV
jgi:hypothetical protein